MLILDLYELVFVAAEAQLLGVGELEFGVVLGVGHALKGLPGARLDQVQDRAVDGDGVGRGEQADVVHQALLDHAEAVAVFGDGHGGGHVGDAAGLVLKRPEGVLDDALLELLADGAPVKGHGRLPAHGDALAAADAPVRVDRRLVSHLDRVHRTPPGAFTTDDAGALFYPRELAAVLTQLGLPGDAAHPQVLERRPQPRGEVPGGVGQHQHAARLDNPGRDGDRLKVLLVNVHVDLIGADQPVRGDKVSAGALIAEPVPLGHPRVPGAVVARALVQDRRVRKKRPGAGRRDALYKRGGDRWVHVGLYPRLPHVELEGREIILFKAPREPRRAPQGGDPDLDVFSAPESARR